MPSTPTALAPSAPKMQETKSYVGTIHVTVHMPTDGSLSRGSRPVHPGTRLTRMVIRGASATSGFMNYTFDFSFLAEYWPELMRGLWLTVKLSAVTISLGYVVGTLLAIGRTSPRRWVRKLSGVYVEVIRNTPLLVQMFLIYFGLASLGWKLNADICAVVAIVINISAYTCEIMRAGIESIRQGQLEAASCLGLSRLQTLLMIVLPPATERVYPALTSQFILIMLTTSVVSQISAEELTSIAARIDSITFRSFEIYLVVALLYIMLAALVRVGFTLLLPVAFPRRRRLATSL